MTKPLINDVSDTALWVATYRAIETDRPDALFKDPLAKILVGERGYEIAAKIPGSVYTEWSVVMRTRIIDAYVQKLVAEGVDTILNLGAGLDTRPYRLTLPPSLHWIEVDFPRLIELKNAKLLGQNPKFRLDRISLDLSKREERKKLFSEIASQSKSVLVITEGVIPYLSNEQTGELADDLHAEPNFRYWIADYLSPQAQQFLRNQKRMQHMKNSPFLFAPGDWHAFFERHRWKVRELRFHYDEALVVKRFPKIPLWMKLVALFMPRERREAFRKMSGYAILEQV